MAEKKYILAIQPGNGDLRHVMAYATAITLKGETKLAWAECGSTAILWVEGDDWLVGAYPLEDMIELYEAKHERDRLAAEPTAAEQCAKVVNLSAEEVRKRIAKAGKEAEVHLQRMEDEARLRPGARFCIIGDKKTRLSVMVPTDARFIPMEYRFGDYTIERSEASGKLAEWLASGGNIPTIHG